VAEKLPISRHGHDLLVKDIKLLVEKQKQFKSFNDKLEAIDKAYASAVDQAIKDAAEDADTPIETPLVVSQVDTVVGYLAEVYLTGYPTFGIVAEGDMISVGEKMEALIDSFAEKSGYTKHILRHFVDGAKYNVNALESAWEPNRILTVQNSNTVSTEAPEVGFELEYLNKLICPDLYNMFWDYRYDPTEVADRGDYIGYNGIYSKIELKRLTLLLNKQDIGMNTNEALSSKMQSMDSVYVERPIISEFITDRKDSNWEEWADGIDANKRKSNIDYSNSYLVTKVYIRIIPNEYRVISPTPAEPEIWKLWVVNLTTIIGMERIYTPNDALPIKMGQYNDDGFAYQTRSVAEGILPWQDVASELINIRLNAARRSLSDRAIYDKDYIDPNDANTRTPAAKIPLKTSLRTGEKSIDSVYRAIPFDSNGVASVSQDLQTTIQMAEYVHGFNSASQGTFRKGNRTLGEFEGVQSGADNRSRLIALREETAVFTPIKQSIKFNILQFQEKTDILALSTGKPLQIDPEELRKNIMEFKVADGFTPKSKLMSPEAATLAFQTVQSVPRLAQEYDISGLFAHLMGTIGFSGVEKYKLTPEQQQTRPPEIDPATGQPVGVPKDANTQV